MSKAAFLLKYGNAKHIHQALNGGNFGSNDVVDSIEKNPYWNIDHTNMVLNQGWGWMTKTRAISHPSTTPEMLHNIISDSDTERSDDLHQLASVSVHPNATEEHHLKIIDKGHHFPIATMLSDIPNKMTNKIYEHAANHPNKDVRNVVAKSLFAPEHILHKLTQDSQPHIVKNAKATIEFNKDVNDMIGDNK